MPLKRRIRIAAASSLLALGALGLVACGGGDDDDDEGAAAGGGAADISMTEFAFDPASLKVSRGDTITVTNDGETTHNYTVPDLKGGGQLTTGEIAPGKSGELIVNLPKGAWYVICTIPGHAKQGMEGGLTVCADGKCPRSPG